MADLFDDARSVLAIVAHPDDESFGLGSLIARAVDRDCRVTVCCASLGEAGELTPEAAASGRATGEIRDEEMQSAADRLGVYDVCRLGLLDSGWDGEPPEGSICGVPFGDLVAKIGAVFDRGDPEIVVTLAGDDGHRDHVRVRDAVVAAGRPRPWTDVYQWCLPNDLMRRWADEMSRLRPETAHLAQEISSLGTPAHEVTDVLDAGPYVATRRHAMAAHVSQTSPYDGLSAQLAAEFFAHDHLRRAR